MIFNFDKMPYNLSFKAWHISHSLKLNNYINTLQTVYNQHLILTYKMLKIKHILQ